jgi:DNA-binding MarR family transcriptional regulator
VPAATAHHVATVLRDSISLLTRRLRQSRLVEDLAPPESSALGELVRSAPVTSAELARRQGISPQSMGATLGSLERRGLVRRSADPEDGRRVLLELTAEGARKAADKRSARTDQLARVLREEFTAAERAQLLAAAPLLDRLADAL